ncbi:MAG: NrfD/PsrC family molybdoenzyme membrane anchor subunit [Thermodesulfobacteriota bacterium]|nr:NrfD/PsrC family molybdoenzyme membrane anchor subunit [Thermodesulfobacteriota bacterium]
MKERPYHWMTTYTAQNEWIEGSGKLIWLALFFMEAGAGLALFSIVSENLFGLVLGWFMVLALGGGAFLAHMGRPQRVFRAVFQPQTSWISRGVIFISLFGIMAAILILVRFLSPNSNPFLLDIATCISSFLVAIYGGILLSYIRALPLWNTGLLPVIFVVAGFWAGAELLLSIDLLMGMSMESAEPWIHVLLSFFALLVPLYLMSVRHSSKA